MRIPEITPEIPKKRLGRIDQFTDAFTKISLKTLIQVGSMPGVGKCELSEDIAASLIVTACTIVSATVESEHAIETDAFELANLLIRTINEWVDQKKLRN